MAAERKETKVVTLAVLSITLLRIAVRLEEPAATATIKIDATIAVPPATRSETATKAEEADPEIEEEDPLDLVLTLEEDKEADLMTETEEEETLVLTPETEEEEETSLDLDPVVTEEREAAIEVIEEDLALKIEDPEDQAPEVLEDPVVAEASTEIIETDLVQLVPTSTKEDQEATTITMATIATTTKLLTITITTMVITILDQLLDTLTQTEKRI